MAGRSILKMAEMFCFDPAELQARKLYPKLTKLYVLTMGVPYCVCNNLNKLDLLLKHT